jgi:hypothetical protein
MRLSRYLTEVWGWQYVSHSEDVEQLAPQPLNYFRLELIDLML